MCGHPPAVVKDRHERSGFELPADAHFNEYA